jgi:hypothetical protein
MKKMLVLLAILSVASIASASFSISVNGVADPIGSVTAAPSGTVNLGIFGAGNTGDSMSMYLLVQGPGITSGGVSLYGGALDDVRTQTSAAWDVEFDLPNAFASFGFPGVTTATVGVFASTVAPQPLLNGQLADLINFHCEGPGTVTLTLVAEDLTTVLDTQTITQVVPEPATMILLAVGGLLLKRRK